MATIVDTSLWSGSGLGYRLDHLAIIIGVIRVVDRSVITSNLAVGWHTIAVFQGRDDSGEANQRFHAKFTLLEYTSSRHQAFTFYAQSMFSNDQGLQVIANSTFGTDVVTAIRIKVSTDGNKTYAGAAIQVYVANATNNMVLYLDEADFDGDEAGSSYGNVILKTGVADASDPGDVGYSTAGYSTFAESVQVGIDSIEPGGIGVTGNLLTQSNIVLEGATADAHETIITATDATADRTITLPDATGQVVLSDGAIDTDASAEIGRAHIGNMGFSDYAGFSHVDQNSTTGYAFLQHSDGNTFLNAPSGSVIDFNIHNSSIALISSTGLHLFGSKVISFEGSTTDDYETTLTVTDPTADRTITLPDASGEAVVTDSSGVTTLTSTTDGGAVLKLVSNDPSDATDWHVENEIQFFAENDASESVEYANIKLYTADVSDGSEDGWIYFAQMLNGTLQNRFAMGPNSNFYILGGGANDPAIEFNAAKGTSYDVQLKPATPSADRTITLPDATGTVALTSDIPSSGISSGNVATFTSGAADNDFLRIDGTAVEGRSASEVLSDIAAMPLAGGTFTGDVTLESTDAGDADAPTLTLFRNSASPADNDDLGRIEFTGKNDAGQNVTYAAMFTEIADASDGTEDVRLKFLNVVAGSQKTTMEIKFGGVAINGRLDITTGGDIRFEGTTADNFETLLSPGDPTADRTITLPDATGTVQLTDGSGASLTSLNASQLSSGTVPNARLDAQLQDVAGLAVTNGGFIVGDGSNFVLETGATARTSLGLGTAAVAATGISNGNVPVFTSGVADDDFLRVNGTSIEGRSASELASDIGAATTDDATALAIALG